MENLDKKQIITIGIVVIIIILVIGYYFINNIKQVNYDYLNDTYEQTEENNTQLETEEELEEIIVHVAGAVKNEGIVKLNEGARVIDAIEAAGGLDDNANLTNVNLAYEIADGQKIYIPYINDEQENNINSENIIIDSYEENEQTTALININTATVAQLQELPGIGSSIAQRIVDYREEYGKFNNIEEIRNVSGIGDAKYNNIKNYITIK